MKRIIMLLLLIALPLVSSESAIEDNFCHYFYLEIQPGMYNYDLIEDINGKYQLQIDAIDPAGLFIGYRKKAIILLGITPDALKLKYSQVACVKQVYDAECTFSDDGEIGWTLTN